jgi:hypothetical protein
MPGNAPPVASEREAISAYLHQQHDAIRFAAYGLTEEQAHTVPSRSAISIANLVRHVTITERVWMHRARTGSAPRDYGDDWDAGGVSIDALLAEFDEVARDTEAASLDESLDLDQPVPVPRDAPWFPQDVDAWSVRWVYFHLLEELARHAGHADIVREHVDGATMYELMAGAEGWPETPWL